MNIKKWIWCLHCEQSFEVFVSKEPQNMDSPLEFTPDFEMQLGVEQNGVVYAECPYLDCDGGMLDFWWWDNFRLDHEAKDTLPEQPEKDVVYPLYPSASK